MATTLLIIIYISFISLGLPDALLGAGWPVMQDELAVPFSLAGLIQIVISGGTILSSMFSGPILRRFGTGKVTSVSVGMTALALVGFAMSSSFVWLIFAAIPLGLGAGAVDTGINAYVASHYEAHHMSWLHSFWGIGAMGGPLVLSMIIGGGASWRTGYWSIGLFQFILVGVLVSTIPLWSRVQRRDLEDDGPADRHLTLLESIRLPGVPLALLVFLFYCAIESSMGLWGGSFLFKVRGMEASQAALWVSVFFGSLTVGRFLTGFLTMRFRNNPIILGGIIVVLTGVLMMILPLPLPVTLGGYILIGLGCAPIFPSMLHETPVRFGAENAQAVMGFQMAVAYIGSTFLPPLFGFISTVIGMKMFPAILMLYALMMLVGFFRLLSTLKQTNIPHS